MLTTRSRTSAVAAAWAGVAAAVGYGALKAVWGLGGDLGLTGPPPWADMPGWQHLLAFWGTVVLAALAVAVLVGLVHAPPRRAVRVLAWLGCLAMLPVGLIGSVDMAATLLGARELTEGELGSMAPATFAFVYGCFLVLGLAFGAAAWLTRRR